MDSEVVRGKPLTKDETKLLLGLIESSPIILSKTKNAASNKMKNEEWDESHPNWRWHSRVHSPDDILDRVADLLGRTASGFVVPFGGDNEEAVFVCAGDGDGDGGGGGGDGDDTGDGAGQARVLSVESIPVLVDTVNGSSTLISEKTIDNATYHEAGDSKLHTPKRTLSSPKIEVLKIANMIHNGITGFSRPLSSSTTFIVTSPEYSQHATQESEQSLSNYC
ncbi:unnamed protein product [Colias eurytheme]|nr:unnamed protein product [Colias eurytheme]